MKVERIETWIWVLIYGGLLSLCLSVFVLTAGGVLGWPLAGLGVLAVAGGVVLIVVRSRMVPPEK